MLWIHQIICLANSRREYISRTGLWDGFCVIFYRSTFVWGAGRYCITKTKRHELDDGVHYTPGRHHHRLWVKHLRAWRTKMRCIYALRRSSFIQYALRSDEVHSTAQVTARGERCYWALLSSYKMPGAIDRVHVADYMERRVLPSRGIRQPYITSLDGMYVWLEVGQRLSTECSANIWLTHGCIGRLERNHHQSRAKSPSVFRLWGVLFLILLCAYYGGFVRCLGGTTRVW